MWERDVFLKEYDIMDVFLGPVLKILGIPGSCSEIQFQKKKFKRTSISSYYSKLNREQQEFVKKRTDEEFYKSTKISRKLKKDVKEDWPYIQHYLRIWECVLRSFMIYSFAPSTYQPSAEERNAIDACANDVKYSVAEVQGIVDRAFSDFRNILEIKEVEREPSFFDQAIKYLVLGTCYFLINSFPAITVIVQAMPKTQNLLEDTMRDVASKIVEDVADKAFGDKQANPILKTQKKITLSEYLTLTGIDKFAFSLNQQDDAYNTTKLNLTTAILSKWAYEGEKKAILQDFRDKSMKKREELSKQGLKQQFYYTEIMRLLADFINSGAAKRTETPSKWGIFGAPRKYYRDYFDLELKGKADYYSGVIAITLGIQDLRLEDLMTKDVMTSNLNAAISIHCSPSENIEKGFRKLIKNFGANQPWGNPFDMPVRKFVNLVFNNGAQVSIFMDYKILGNPPTNPVYALTYFYKDPEDVSIKKSHYNSYPIGDSTQKVPYYLDMELVFGKSSCDNLLLNLYTQEFKSQFPMIGGKRKMDTHHLAWTSKSLDIVKEKTRNALLR